MSKTTLGKPPKFKPYFLRDEGVIEHMMAFIAQNWRAFASAGKCLVVEFKTEKDKRSLEANRYYWQMLNQVSENGWYQGHQFRPDQWHEQFRDLYLPKIDLPMGGSRAVSTSDLCVEDFNEYTRKCEAFAMHELGVRFVEAA